MFSPPVALQIVDSHYPAYLEYKTAVYVTRLPYGRSADGIIGTTGIICRSVLSESPQRPAAQTQLWDANTQQHGCVQLLPAAEYPAAASSGPWLGQYEARVFLLLLQGTTESWRASYGRDRG